MSRIPWKRSRLGNLWAQEGNDGTGYRIIIAKDRQNRRPTKPYHLMLMRDGSNNCRETLSYFTTEARAVAAAEKRYVGPLWRWHR